MEQTNDRHRDPLEPETGVPGSDADPAPDNGATEAGIDPEEVVPAAPTAVLPVLPSAGPVSRGDIPDEPTARSLDAVTERVPLPSLPRNPAPPAAPDSAGPDSAATIAAASVAARPASPVSAPPVPPAPRPPAAADAQVPAATAADADAADAADRRPIGPQRIEPTEPRTRSRRPLLLAIAAVILVAAAGLGFWAYTALGTNSTDNRIRDAVTTYADGLQNGDLAAVRSGTCGDLEQFYAGLSDSDFAAVRDEGVRDGSIPRIDSIDAIRLDTEDSAIVAVTVSTDQESTGTTRTFDLNRVDGQWKVCG